MKVSGRALGLVVLAAVALSVYSSALVGGFVWDDQALIVQNPTIRSWHHWREVLSRDFFHLHDEPTPYGYYRPIVTLTYILDHQIWGLNPLGYHLSNVLLHVVNVLLVALILLRLHFSDRFAFAVAFLFAVHPIHTENVSWIAGRTDLLAFALTAGAFLMHLAAINRMRPEGAGPLPVDAHTPGRALPRLLIGASILFFALSLLAKEMSIVLVPWLALSLRFRDGFTWSRIARALSPYAIVLAGYGWLRFSIFEIEVPAPPSQHSLSLALLSAPPTVLRYLGWMLLPFDLSAYVQNPYVDGFADPALLGSVTVLGLVGYAIWRLFERPAERLVAGMLLISFLPILNLVRVAGPADMGNAMAERFCYFPSFPFLAALLIASGRVLGNWRRSALARSLGLALLGSLSVTWAVQTIARTEDWRDEHTLVAKTLGQSPSAPLMWKLLGLSRLKRSLSLQVLSPEGHRIATRASEAELRAAAEAYQTVVALDPLDAAALHNLGAALHRLGDTEKAATALQNAIRIRPSYAKAYINLGAVLQERGENGAAIKAYRRAIVILEENVASTGSAAAQLAAAHYNLGRALLEGGDNENATGAFRHALKTRPELVVDLVNEARLRVRKGDLGAAVAMLDEALKAQPGNVSARVLYAENLVSLGRTAEARGVIEDGLALASESHGDTLRKLLAALEALSTRIEDAASEAKR